MQRHEFDAMVAADERHWWYRGRRRVLRSVLDRLSLPGDARILDAGCGSGRTLDELEGYGRVCGIDVSVRAIGATRGRGHPAWLSAVERTPFTGGIFDLVTCLDVLEHTPDDRLTLRELLRVTRPGGRLVVTVPAYPRLWSAHDEVNQHYRRYTRRSLRAAARGAGWHVAAATSFNGAVLPVAAPIRKARRHYRGRSELQLTSPAADRLLELPLRLEAMAIRCGARLPAGLSLLMVLTAPASVALQPRAVPLARPAAVAAVAH
jgi:SAM-dependent methyltransferase